MSIEIPEFLAHLPIHRGYPVPYFVPVQDGKALFNYASGELLNNCLKYHKCCVCFRPLINNNYWFVSGPNGLVNQVDSHTPMHKKCAEYSMNVCPHLFFEKTHRTSDETLSQQGQIREKPKELYLVLANKYSRYPDNSMFLIQFKKISFEKFTYQNGTLSRA